jgi:hypothetical protein
MFSLQIWYKGDAQMTHIERTFDTQKDAEWFAHMEGDHVAEYYVEELQTC